METHTSQGKAWKKLYSAVTSSAVSAIEVTGLSLKKKNTKLTILIQNDTGPEGTSDVLLYLNDIGGDPSSAWWTGLISASTASSVSRVIREASFLGRIYGTGKFYIYITFEYTGPTVIVETRIESTNGDTVMIWRGTLRFKPSGAGEDYDVTDIKIVSASYDFPAGTEIVIWGWS